MRSNPINFLYNLDHMTLWCVEVVPVANARELEHYLYVFHAVISSKQLSDR